MALGDLSLGIQPLLTTKRRGKFSEEQQSPSALDYPTSFLGEDGNSLILRTTSFKKSCEVII